MDIFSFIIVGIIAGAMSAFLGIGGAVVIIPFLVFILGFDQKTAQGTTLALMIPPIGLLAVIEYYKAGKVNIKAAVIIATAFVIGSFIGSKFALKIDNIVLKKTFGVFLLYVAGRMLIK